MVENIKRTNELLEKSNTLPLVPGVYIMKDKNGKIIYVGKSKKLKNRVSQYFQNSKKNIKTYKMVSLVDDFDYIVCKTEIEALTLENSLIKLHSPKYNIKLKDAKSYPYIKITNDEYPRIVFTRARRNDKAKYFGPFSGVSVVFSILDIIHKSIGIPNCKKRFPQDIAKGRPCIYYQMNQCCGLCTGKVTRKDYMELIQCASEILRGNTGSAVELLKKQMYALAEEERFEAAAKCRDAINALERLKQKQSVVSSLDSNFDIFGFFSDEISACISSMYVRGGTVTDKNDFVFNSEAITDSNSLSSFLVEHYIKTDYIPKEILISFELEEADKITLERFLSERASHKVTVRRPERGANRELCKVLEKNAEEKARQSKIEAEKEESVLIELASLLRLECVPSRIEAYDISNIGAENITAGMVVFKEGKAQRSDYRSFNIKTVSNGTDDYASMREAITRRLEHLKTDTNGSFSEYPDLLLIDGGKGHISTVKQVLNEQGMDIPVFGMVKDDYHKTRALCTDTQEINIAKHKAIFMLIYKIQEEVHRFTVTKTTNAKRKTLKHSSLEKIEGIGPAKAKALMTYFGTLAQIKNATEEELVRVKGITPTNALSIIKYFTKN